MTGKELVDRSVRELAELLGKREVSASEIARAYADRIGKMNGSLNAYVYVNAPEAVRSAERFDREEHGSGEGNMLAGIPYAVKDNIAVAGIPMTCASNMLKGFVPDYTADVCGKAGDIILGKTNLDEFAMGSTCERSVFGATPNPLDTDRICGGSSGGSASAVAAGLAPWALGTDTGGSARLPAAYCGLVAMKPTYGLISRYGVTELASSMDTVSPMTRNVTDNAWIFDRISGKSRSDMTSTDPAEDSSPSVKDGVKGLRIAALDCGNPVFDRACDRLRKAGAEVEDACGSLDEILDCAIAIYYFINSAESFSNMSRYDGIRYGLRGEGGSYEDMVSAARDAGLGEEVRRRIISGAKVLSLEPNGAYYRRILGMRAVLEARMDRYLSGYDAVFMMTSEREAPHLSGSEDQPQDMYFMDSRTCIANLSGCPSLTVPIGGRNGMPLGGSLMGRKLSEPVLYRAAYVLEQELESEITCEVRRTDE